MDTDIVIVVAVECTIAPWVVVRVAIDEFSSPENYPTCLLGPAWTDCRIEIDALVAAVAVRCSRSTLEMSRCTWNEA